MRRRFLYMAVMVLACIFFAGCAATTPPVRTLPTHIKRIYIPEFKNGSRMYGAGPELTLAVNDEFMLDGRLDVVQNDRADIRLEGRIKSFRETGTVLSYDRFPYLTGWEMVCVVELWDPYDADRQISLGRYTVPAVVSFTSDPRYTLSETETEARKRLVDQMAQNIVYTVINGTPEKPHPIEQARVQRYQQSRGPDKYEPVITEPRFPKPTTEAQPETEE